MARTAKRAACVAGKQQFCTFPIRCDQLHICSKDSASDLRTFDDDLASGGGFTATERHKYSIEHNKLVSPYIR